MGRKELLGQIGCRPAQLLTASRLPGCWASRLQGFQAFGQMERLAQLQISSRLSDFWANMQLAQLQTGSRIPGFWEQYL